MAARKVEIFSGGKCYEDSLAPDPKGQEKIWTVIESINNQQPIACGIETALSHTKFINLIQSEVAIRNFDKSCILKKQHESNPNSIITYVDGLYNRLQVCFQKTLLLSEGEG